MISNYPKGFRDGITLKEVPLLEMNAGKIFWVNNSGVLADGEIGASDGNKGSFLQPFSTIDFAVSKCKADRGDVIAVKPGHSETISAAAAIDLDVDGIVLMGIGNGDKQPQIISDNAASTVEINADNVSIVNMRFTAGATVVAKGLDIVDGADDFRVEGCRFDSATPGTFEFEDSLFVTTADRGLIEGNHFDMDDQADADSAIHLVGACLGCVIRNNMIMGDYTIACIESVTAAQEQILIEGNTLINGVHGGLNTVACISLLTGTTGFIQDNRLYTNVASAVTAAIAADGCFIAENPLVTTAESPASMAEGGLNGALIVKSAVKTAVADEAIDDLFTITGVVDIYGIVLRVTTASDSDQTMGIFFDSTSGNDDLTIHALANHDLNAVGDTLSGSAAGGVWAETIVPGDTTPIWDAPLRLPAGTIETLVGGVAGALVSSITVYYSLVSEGATLTVA